MGQVIAAPDASLVRGGQSEAWPKGNIFVTIASVLELRYYVVPDGKSPFEDWFASLDANAGAKVSVALVGATW